MTSSARRTLLKSVLAAALLAWVASGLPWSDSLVYVSDPEAAESAISVEGDIDGGWREDRIRFEISSEASVGGGWPDEAKAAFQNPRGGEFQRREAGAVGYEWRPGMPRVFLDLQLEGLFTAFLGLFLGLAFGVTRWWRILHLAGCRSSWWNTLRLAALGLFFNLVLPGITGGDLPKALMVVRENPGRRADALATVVIDRLVGLWSLVVLACAVIWTVRGDFAPLLLPSAGAFLALSLGLLFVLLPGPRRALRLDRLIARLPQAERIRKLERAALLYRGHGGELVVSVLLSLGNHLSVIAAMFAIGRAFGAELSFSAFIGIGSVASLITSLPLSPGGWGVGEAAFGTLFEMMGAVAALGVAVSVTYRLCTVVLGLAGGLCMWLPGSPNLSRDELIRDPDDGLAG